MGNKDKTVADLLDMSLKGRGGFSFFPWLGTNAEIISEIWDTNWGNEHNAQAQEKDYGALPSE